MIGNKLTIKRLLLQTIISTSPLGLLPTTACCAVVKTAAGYEVGSAAVEVTPVV